MRISTSDRCADCGKIDKLAKCSKEACPNKICPTCVDRYSGKHCNSCYASVGNVRAAEWAMTRIRPMQSESTADQPIRCHLLEIASSDAWHP
jgi:hypothetical protein